MSSMRRAQSVRSYVRPSLAIGSVDDLGVLRESDESVEDTLRRQLIEKDRENDRLKTTIQTLQDQLAQRPPLELVQEIEKEYRNLELLLQGTQRENERCMSEIERGKAREKMLERELARLAGENWQSTLNIPTSQSPTPTAAAVAVRSALGPAGFLRARPASAASTEYPLPAAGAAADAGAMRAYVEQVRLLVLGMEQRLEAREGKLESAIDRAEKEAKRFAEMQKVVTAPEAV